MLRRGPTDLAHGTGKLPGPVGPQRIEHEAPNLVEMAGRSFTNPYHTGLGEHGLDAPTIGSTSGSQHKPILLQTCDGMGESAGGVAHVESQIGHAH